MDAAAKVAITVIAGVAAFALFLAAIFVAVLAAAPS